MQALGAISVFIAAISLSVAASTIQEYTFNFLEVDSKDMVTPLSENAFYSRTFLDCLTNCGVLVDCLSVLYDKDTNLCMINSDIVVIRSDAVIPNVGSNFLLGYSQEGSWTIETATSNRMTTATVLLTTATASPGCSNCSEYGGTFDSYPGMALYGFDDIIYGVTVNDCLDACIEAVGFFCRSADYHPSSETCQLDSGNYCTRPDDFSIFSYDYYHRRCDD